MFKRFAGTLLIFTILSAWFAASAAPVPDLPVFPGAEGFGSHTPAGRGGAVYKVSNLNSSGQGSLRACVEASGPRVCIFEISGTIDMRGSDLNIRNPFLTLAGHTAPGPILIKDGTLTILTHDVLIRHISIRRGDRSSGKDALALSAGNGDIYNLVIDHVSISWATDENIGAWIPSGRGREIRDITISNTIISEPLKQNNYAGVLFGSGTPGFSKISLIRNLFSQNQQRNPKYSGGSYANINNVIYNWKNLGIDHGPPRIEGSIVGNVFISGIATTSRPINFRSSVPADSEIFLDDNMWDGNVPSNQWTLVQGSSVTAAGSPPVWPQELTTLPSSQVEVYVLGNVGSRPGDRDPVDNRVVQTVKDRQGSYVDSQNDVGGWPNIQEIQRSLTIPDNPSGDDDGDGYTNLEEWLHDYAAEVEGRSPSPSPTFSDVPFDHLAHDEIEVLYQNGYVAGCSSTPLMYCPDSAMTRAESAVFVIRGVHSAGYTPPDPISPIFSDVPLAEWFSKWSTALWNEAYSAGCGIDPLVYCPMQEHTRTEGTVFFLRMLNGVNYVPPAASGIFADVDKYYWGAKWIEAAYNAGLIPACQTAAQLQFCPDEALDRAMAAHMMVQAKGLPIN